LKVVFRMRAEAPFVNYVYLENIRLPKDQIFVICVFLELIRKI
jgi:hypothetical protein